MKMKKYETSRRDFLKFTACGSMLAALGQFQHTAAAVPMAQDYKALVCIFLFGGNDGHNTVVPMSASEYNAYISKRGGLALTGNRVLPVTTSTGGQYGFNYGMVELQGLFQPGQLPCP